MKTLLATATTALFTVTVTPAAFAGNAGESLGACYNHVISACNQTNHPIPCSEAGMDACDDLHNASLEPDPIEKIKLLKMPDNKYRVILNPRPVRFHKTDDAERTGRGGRDVTERRSR